MPWIDQHCHLPPGDDGATQVAEAHACGVLRMVSVGCDLDQSRQMIEAAIEHKSVYATAGVHPHEADGGIAGIEELLQLPEVVAIGECGLDYHYDNSARDAQRAMFAAQIQLAHRYEIPLVIHSRSAWDETFEILDREGVPEKTVFHCFTGGPEEARACLARGAKISFSGIITFQSAGDLRDAAAECPINDLMVETDSPYLAPVPHRGKLNRPALVPLVGAAVAAAKGIDVGEVEAATWRTAADFYGLSQDPDRP